MVAMKLRRLTSLAAALGASVAMAACGSGVGRHLVRVKAAPAPVPQSQAYCAERHELGCQVAKVYGHVRRSVGPLGSSGGLGVDVSQWQGYSPDFSGLRFAILQSNYGTNVEPTIYSQIRDARAHHIPYGCYEFGEPGASGEAGERLAASICRGAPLGIWYDAEIGGAYSQAFAFNDAARRAGLTHGTYTSPGLWPYSNAPSGYLWAAIWSSGYYSYGGWRFSSIKIHQFCGTCSYHGIGDLDKDTGILATVRPPETAAQHRAKLKRELAGHEAVLQHLRIRKHVLVGTRSRPGVLVTHGCTHKRHLHKRLGEPCTRWFHEGDTIHSQGNYEDRVIAQLKKELR
jgi:hypothetical protein